MNKKTKLSLIPVTVAALLAGALLWGNTAGAKPLPSPGIDPPVPAVPTEGGVAGDAFQAWASAVNGAIAALDAGKANEDNVVTLVDEEDADPDAQGRVRYCFNQLLPADADYPEPAVSNQPGTEACPAENLVSMPEGPVVKHIDVTPVPGPVPSPYNFQVGHLTTTGAVIKVFDINGDVITSPVRFTVEASYSYPAAAG